jgi:hypothetical protein
VGTALIALVAGAFGAGITGVLGLRRDRVETLRQRQLDAADAFAAAAARVLRSVSDWLDSFPDETDVDYMQEWRQEKLEEWRHAGRQLHVSLQEQVGDVTAHGPRIELLFGVESPASVAALQTSYDLMKLAKYFRPYDDGALTTARWAYKLGIHSAMRFHDEANIVIASSWWRRLRHKTRRDTAFEEMRAQIAAARAPGSPD